MLFIKSFTFTLVSLAAAAAIPTSETGTIVEVEARQDIFPVRLVFKGATDGLGDLAVDVPMVGTGGSANVLGQRSFTSVKFETSPNIKHSCTVRTGRRAVVNNIRPLQTRDFISYRVEVPTVIECSTVA
jgi:hypothetical protein